MKNTLEDYKVHLKNIPIKCDNTHHFIRDHVTNHDLILEFIDTKHQLANIFTKLLGEEQYDFIRRELGMLIYLNA